MAFRYKNHEEYDLKIVFSSSGGQIMLLKNSFFYFEDCGIKYKLFIIFITENYFRTKGEYHLFEFGNEIGEKCLG